MDKKNYEKNIIIPSEILEEEIFKKKVKYFFWLLELKKLASDETTEVNCNGCKVMINKNQICTTYPELEKTLGASKTAIQAYFRKMENEGILTRHKTNKYQIITLLV